MDKLNLAIDYYLSGDIKAAKKLFEEHIDSDGPSLSQAYYHLGLCYADQNLLTDACHYLQKSITLEPNKAIYHYRLGMVYSRLMILDKAISELSIAIKINPEHIRAKYLLGTLYYKDGDISNTERVFSELIKSSPDFAASYYHRALAYFHLGDNDRAKTDLYKAIELNSSYNEANIKLAEILATEKNFISSLKLTRQIYNDNIKSYTFLVLHIKQLIANNLLEEATTILDEAKLLYPHHKELNNII